MKNIERIILIISILLSTDLFSQVVINEVHMRPTGSSTGTNPQNLADCAPNSGGEFIELYNPDPCSSVDISCYIIANNIAGTSTSAQGAFRFPSGTVIPPLGFVSIGGAHSGATFILNNYCGTNNLATHTSGRWYLPNGDGYLMLYNSSGSPIDAVYWTTDGNAAKWGTDSDINTNPTLIPSGTGGCAVVSSLSGPANLPISVAEHIGVASGAGLSSSRQTDGSLTWVPNSANTINACNGACVIPTTFTVSASVNQPTCGNTDGNITLTPSPAGTYTYTWTPNVSATNSASNLGAGNYQISVNDGSCTWDTTITLAAPTPFIVSSSVNQLTCGNTDGSISFTPSPAGTYTYTWTPNVSTTNSASNLSAGSYQIEMSDGSCTWDTTIILNSPTGCGCLNPMVLSTDSTSNTVCNGSSTPCVYNGPDIVFNEIRINPGTATNSIGTVLGTANGLEFIELYNPNPCSSIDLSCYILAGNNGVDNKSNWSLRFPAGTVVSPLGFLTIAGDNVIGADIYPKDFVVAGAWDNINFISADPAAAWLMNGSDWKALYEPNGTPVAGLAWSYSVDNISYINSSSNYNATPTVLNNAGCPNSSSLSSIRTMYNSGTVPVDFLSGIGTGVWARSVDGTGAWTFNSNVNSATVSACNSVCAPPQPGGSSSCNGTATVSVTSGGTSPFSYQWNDPLNQTTATADSLCPGVYCVTVTDASGICIENICVEVLDASSIDFTSSVTQSSCANNDGEITVSPIVVGTYTYTWTPNVSTTSSASNLFAGIYQIEVSDGSCTWDTTITLNSAAPFLVSSTVNNPSCANNDGEISFTPNPVGAYTYTWTPNVSTTNSANNLATGSYQIEVSYGSCSWDTTITLTAPIPFTTSSTVIQPTCGLNNGSISILNSMPGIYTYTWVPNVSNSSVGSNLSAGSYLVSISNGSCSFDTTINLINSGTFPVSDFSYVITDSICSLSGVTNNLSINGSDYTWLIDNQFYSNNTSIDFEFDDNQIHTITLQTISAEGCADVKSLIVDFEFFESPIFVPNVFTPSNKDNMNDEWYVIADCVEEFECLIFNRWGNKLYTLTNINDKWDGTYNGKEVPQGIYVYVMTLKKKFTPKIVKHGHITKL
ncbi:MAG: lamin tail domain-containing protein [Flavobacteriales bacterium]